jgi:sulfatase maturation enzyme AslB (radical SAM superfamily)
MAATAKGSDMSVETFRKGIAIANQYGESVMIGGGEPTLNPNFELILLYAIAVADTEEMTPAIVTNGKIKERALLIASLTKKGILCGELSRDCFHDDIDDEVVEAFQEHSWYDKYGSKHTRSLIRDVTHDFQGNWRDPSSIAGRELKRRGLTRRPQEDSCPCDDTFVRPNGKIYQCGCHDSPCIGNVDDGYSSPSSGVCFRSKEYKEERDAA